MRLMIIGAALLCAGSLLGCTAGSTATTRPSNIHQRQEQALKDPFHYSPDMGNNDISGGGLSNFDNNAFKRDVDSVLNP